MEYPKKAIYKRQKNRIYFVTDFEDGEELEFAYTTGIPSSMALGYVFYRSVNSGWEHLINLKDIDELYLK